MTKAIPLEPALAQAPWAQAEAAQPTPKRTGPAVRNVPGGEVVPAPDPDPEPVAAGDPRERTKRKGPSTS